MEPQQRPFAKTTATLAAGIIAACSTIYTAPAAHADCGSSACIAEGLAASSEAASSGTPADGQTIARMLYSLNIHIPRLLTVLKVFSSPDYPDDAPPGITDNGSSLS